MTPQSASRQSKSSPKSDTPIVFVIGDDSSALESLELLICSEGLLAETVESVEEFLSRPKAPVPCCLLLDVAFPGMDGLELQKRVAAERSDLPIIFVADHDDVAMTVQAMKGGAVDFLTRPFGGDLLLTAVRQALQRSRIVLDHEAEIKPLRDCYQSLTRREREVMALVVSGLPNKQVGGELGISEVTVKAHRGQVMKKMKANSLADLVKMAEKLRLTLTKRE
jgi:FixJ family two-component response regulator